MSLMQTLPIKPNNNKIKVKIPKARFLGPAEHAWNFASQLQLPEIIGNPTFGETAAPWMKDLFFAIFGDTDYSDPKFRRKISNYFLLIPKKNAKTTTAALIMLTNLIQTPLSKIQMILLGASEKVAFHAYRTIKNAIEADPELSSMIKIKHTEKLFFNLQNGCELIVQTPLGRASAGSKAPYIFVDELWEIGKLQNGSNVITEITGGIASYPQGFVIYASTQSDNPPHGVFAEELNTARNIRDGKLEVDNYCPILFEYPQKMIKDQSALIPENFHLVNPSIGYSVDIDYLINKAKIAANEGGEKWRQFTAKHLNIEPGHYAAVAAWSVAEYWDKYKKDYDFHEFMQKADVLTFGVDVGGRSDFFAITAIAYNREEKSYYTYARAWLTRDGYYRITKKRDLSGLVDNRQLRLVETYEDAQSASTDFIAELMAHKKFYRFGYDPMDADRLLNLMKGRRLKTNKAFPVPHGYRLTPFLHKIDGLVGDGKMFHQTDDLLLTMCVLNVKLVARGSNVMIDKNNSTFDKIDNAIALALAISQMKEDYNSEKVTFIAR